MREVKAPISFGLTGLGGYAAYVCERLLEQASAEAPAARLLGVCDPNLDRFPGRVAELRARGVTVVRDFSELLDQPIEAVWLPVPIELHLPFSEQALAAGKAVMCEKPAAATVDEVDLMIAARDRSGGLPLAIGFQDMYQPAVGELKRRLVAGEFGRTISARVIGCWPRSDRYFTRNDWAGAMRHNGRWVMDSPASNALAHFLNLTLFLMGDGVSDSATPTAVAAELYRANPIENYDTCSIRFTIAGGQPVLVAFTHASASTVDPIVVIETERARISYIAGRHIEIQMTGGAETRLPLSAQPHQHMLSAFRDWVRNGGDAPESAPGATLEVARAHVVAVNAASEAAPVCEVAVDHVRVGPSSDGSIIRTIEGIVPAMRACFTEGCLLHEGGRVPWSQAAGTRQIRNYTHFAGPAPARPPINGKVQATTYVSPTAAPTPGRAHAVRA